MPFTFPTAGDIPKPVVNTASLRVRRMLRSLSDEELHQKFQVDLMAGKGLGQPVSTSNLPSAVAKALSGNTNGQVLVRQDLEPILSPRGA